jgi:antitoxin component YwqK of YwqJK toxin-antitoxin module
MLSCKSKSYEISVQSDLVEFFENGSVELKESIPDGKYFIISSEDCNNKDTLLFAEIKNRQKEGKWIYYNQLPPLDSCDFEKELEQIDFYKNGNLLSCEYYTGSGIMKTIYQPNQKKHNGDKIVIDHRYEDGSRRIDSIRNDNHASIFDFGKNGDLETKTEWINDTSFIQQFYPSGRISDEYKIVRFFIDNNMEETFDGEATTWNEKGEVIKIVNYQMGKIIQE